MRADLRRNGINVSLGQTEDNFFFYKPSIEAFISDTKLFSFPEDVETELKIKLYEKHDKVDQIPYFLEIKLQSPNKCRVSIMFQLIEIFSNSDEVILTYEA